MTLQIQMSNTIILKMVSHNALYKVCLLEPVKEGNQNKHFLDFLLMLKIMIYKQIIDFKAITHCFKHKKLHFNLKVPLFNLGTLIWCKKCWYLNKESMVQLEKTVLKHKKVVFELECAFFFNIKTLLLKNAFKHKKVVF